MENVAAAKAVYDKALLASANAPLLIVGMGQVELMENKINEARQRFEAAITLTSGKKGEDPVILNAVGRAITNTYTEKEKKGDINFAVQKLQAAAPLVKKDNNLLADIYVNLGNAIRKAQPGSAGGPAFENYQKAMEANPAFATAYLRTAQLFNTQRNWDLYEKYLNDAIAKDPKFAPAYYELYYYKFSKLDFNTAEQMAQKYIESSDPSALNDYLKIQIQWAKKDYDQAINGAKGILDKADTKTKVKALRLIGDSYLAKKDTATGKQYIDQLFSIAKADDLNANDFKLKAAVYSAISGQEDVVYQTYLDGVAIDTVIDNKVDLLKTAALYFRGKGQRSREGDMMAKILEVKPNFTINEMFDAGRAYYFGKEYAKSRDIFLKFQEKYPNEIFGYEWASNNSRVIDTTKKDSIAVPDAVKLLSFSEKDTTKFKKQYLSAAGYLVGYYANDAKDGAKALEYVNKMLLLDPNNDGLKGIKQQLEKGPKSTSTKPAGQPKASATIEKSKPVAVAKKPTVKKKGEIA
jgi:hypothetical protein